MIKADSAGLYIRAINARKEFEEALHRKDNPDQLEMLNAIATKLWRDFEDIVWVECKLPRHELLIKRANFG